MWRVSIRKFIDMLKLKKEIMNILDTIVIDVNQCRDGFNQNNLFYDPGSLVKEAIQFFESPIYNIISNDTIQLIEKPKIKNPFLVRAALFEGVCEPRLGREAVNKLFEDHANMSKCYLESRRNKQ